MADNFEFRITGASLEKSLDVAASGWKNAEGWSVDKDGKRLIFYWTKAKYDDFNAFPAPMPLVDLIPFIKAWLNTTDYGREPDIDGDTGKGWTVYNEHWGHVAGRWEAFVAIEPTWMMYGK